VTSKNYFRDELFEANASPEAIAAKLHGEQQAAMRVARRIEWLEHLLTRRTAEKDAGQWPPATDDTAAESAKGDSSA
jgi:hypothetical protein